jgi:hypothetical protein
MSLRVGAVPRAVMAGFAPFLVVRAGHSPGRGVSGSRWNRVIWTGPVVVGVVTRVWGKLGRFFWRRAECRWRPVVIKAFRAAWLVASVSLASTVAGVVEVTRVWIRDRPRRAEQGARPRPPTLSRRSDRKTRQGRESRNGESLT